uniref:ZP domain-containing protein n=1 Tax=Strongyloides papillosus TaxID=174720 RepID=A0A0N5BZV3_STREA
MRVFKTLLVIITILICRSFEVIIYLDFLLDVQGFPTCDPEYPNEKVTLKIINRKGDKTLKEEKGVCGHLIKITETFTAYKIVKKVLSARFFYETSKKFYTRRIVEDCKNDAYEKTYNIQCNFGDIP